MPIGMLMKEHRLIERVIALLRKHHEDIDAGGRADPLFIETCVDFIRTYADRCHHGKEEDILFAQLRVKNLSPEHRRTMQELMNEHVEAREKVRDLVEAKDRYAEGEEAAIGAIKFNLRWLAEFYPEHIEKEDKHFFIPVMEYFSKEEQDAMIEESARFDAMMIHEKYRRMVEEQEKGP